TWRYEQASNEIVVQLPPGSFVTVEYVEDCDGVLDGCSDGIDNDNDGLVDYPDEPGCDSPFDFGESDPLPLPACSNGLDDDGDGLVDYPAETGCDSAGDDFEDLVQIDADAFGYRLHEGSGTPSPCPDLSRSGPALPLGDEGTALVNLGFDFPFYGLNHSSVYVGANGTLDFSLPLSPPSSTCLPASGPEQAIFVWWEDLDPA
ncbi:MAG: hypothetical protein AAF211_34325, partial [Myxococcota bacterium]